MMKTLSYIIIMCGFAAAVVCLTGCRNNLYGKESAVELDMETDVDSTYIAFKQAEKGKAIPLANHFFYLLDANEITDSLVQYASPADMAMVGAHTDYWMAEYLYQTNRHKESLTLAEMALQEAETLGDTDLEMNVNSLLTAIYHRLGMLDDALRCLQVCLDEDERTGDKENLSSDLNNMAALFLSLKQFQKAQAQIDRAIEIEKELGRENVLAIRYGIASEIYMSLDKLVEAERFAREAYRLDVDGGREGKAAIRLSQLASVLMKKAQTAHEGKQDFSEAKEVLNQAIPVLKRVGNTYSYIVCENQLGDVFLAEKDFRGAEKHYNAAFMLSEGEEFKYMKQRALQGLWKAMRNTDVKRAADFLEQYAELADSLHTESTERQLANMQAQFEYKELRNEHERLVNRHQLLTVVVVAGVVIFLLMVAVLCYGIYARRKEKIINKQSDVMLELIEENARLETANEDEEKAEKQDVVAVAGDGNDAEFYNKFVTYVNNCLNDGKAVVLSDCASHLCVSTRHFSRRITQITGSSPTAYINKIKINRAKRLIEENPALSNAELSVKCGFDDPAYFGRVFRQLEGVSPQQYRN